jgi:hypothetical protein
VGLCAGEAGFVKKKRTTNGDNALVKFAEQQTPVLAAAEMRMVGTLRDNEVEILSYWPVASWNAMA